MRSSGGSPTAGGERTGRLTDPVRGPFDRMLITQALLHNLELVSNEEVSDWYGINRPW